MLNLLLVGNWESGVGYAWRMMEQFWVALARAYPDRKTVLCFPKVTTVNPDLVEAGIEIVEFNFDLARPLELARFIRQHQIGHLYLSDRAYSTWVYRLLRFAGVRTITVHDHTPGPRTVPKGLKRFAKGVSTRLMGADAYIATSNYVLDRLRNVALAPANRCFLAQNGVVPNTLTRQHETIRAELGISPHTLLVVSSSRATRYKRIDDIIEAAALLKAARPEANVRFIHCGNGPDFDFFSKLVMDRGLQGYYRLLGARSDMASVLVGCDIAVHASQGEVGLSLAILEFMSAGLPAVIADDPSVCQCIRDGDSGLLFRSGSPQDLSAKLL